MDNVLSESGERVFGTYILMYEREGFYPYESGLTNTLRICLHIIWDKHNVPLGSYEYYHIFGLAAIVAEEIYFGRKGNYSTDTSLDRVSLFLHRVTKRQFLWWQVPAGSVNDHRRKLQELMQYSGAVIREWSKI